jgi:hypothetical protein
MRRFVWVAVGMAKATFDVNAEDALVMLRGYAYARNALLDDVAVALVDGRLGPAQIRS